MQALPCLSWAGIAREKMVRDREVLKDVLALIGLVVFVRLFGRGTSPSGKVRVERKENIAFLTTSAAPRQLES